MTPRRDDFTVPATSIVLGYGPMLPLVGAVAGVWLLPGAWPYIALRLAIVWAALVLAFIAGVRRGFGFGAERASTATEIAASLAYFACGGLALVSPSAGVSLALLIVGYALAALLDARAAHAGDAPAHFARLRPTQMLLGGVALAVLWLWLLH